MINRLFDDNGNNDHGEDIQTVSLAEHARRDADYVLTLEEIGALAAEGGKPAETLMNVVALIARRFQTDVCSAYLLEPDRANLVLAATLGLRRQCIGTLRMALHEGLAGPGRRTGAPGRRGSRSKNHPRFKYFSEAGRRSLSIVPRRAADRSRRACRACWWFRPSRRALSRRRSPDAGGGRRAGGAGGQRGAHARSFHRARRRNGCGRWRATCGGVGITTTISLFRDLDPVRWRAAQPQSDFAAERDAAGSIGAPRRRTGAAQPDQLRLPPPAGISAGGPHLGRDACRRAAAASGGVFFRRVRPARIDADLFRRARRACRRSHQERVRSGYPADRHRAVLRPGLFPPAAGSQRLAAGRISADRRQRSCPWNRRSEPTASR